MFLQVQTGIAAAIFILFVAFAIFLVKPEHLEGGKGKWRVIIGAAIEGAIVGLILAFLLFPGYFDRKDFHPLGPDQIFTLQAQAVLLPSFIVSEFVRNGGLAILPGFSYFLRPRRRAILVRQKMHIEKRLAKMDSHGRQSVESASMAPA